jgi:hypothetical protein
VSDPGHYLRRGEPRVRQQALQREPPGREQDGEHPRLAVEDRELRRAAVDPQFDLVDAGKEAFLHVDHLHQWSSLTKDDYNPPDGARS